MARAEYALLFVFLHDLGRAQVRFVWIVPRLSEGSTLAQKIPALIQLDIEFLQTLAIGICQRPLPIQAMFL